ncbi:MAG: 16S rRNA (cytosine(967)-C(5))-methyltransferase RsmB [Desulfobacter sp.]|nr:16S rRNA (cytosine(967)-C(5))-methyltransferase RsmB [Desulfobacter sp.]
MHKDLRHIAFSLLESSQKKKITLDRAIEDARENLDRLSVQDRSLCNAIVFGVLRHRGRLDQIIETFSKLPFQRLDRPVKTILRMGIFQLVFLDRIPDFAAIHSSIELAKLKTNQKSCGFINALLRKASDPGRAPALPDKKKQFIAYLKVAYSIQSWMGKRWTARFGKQRTQGLCAGLMEIPPITLRVNTLKSSPKDLSCDLSEHGIENTRTTVSKLGILISKPGRSMADLPGFDHGHFQVQDEAAQLVTQILGPKPKERILDACAGLGGKTCHIGQMMNNMGRITANDPDPGKLERLSTEAQRLGISIIEPESLDLVGSSVKNFNGYFDRVLVDAPCSGLGVMRRNPDTRWKRGLKDVQRMAGLQKKILNAAAGLVRPGGVLVYAVCSCEPEENEIIIDSFLKRRKDYLPDNQDFLSSLCEMSNSGSDFQFKTYPCLTQMDGFFAARMRRRQAP